ncbi:MAG TPA: mandelate racemase/muconate lactonizing enzyme family protein [Bryobacteraceae bacterium]|nr:mandelate racemase/muconate lactonizing enzyme family protein [Bryobacteraceae bacterium]
MMRRRDFLTTLAMPAAGLFATFERMTAADRGKVRITDIKMKPISGVGHTLIRIDTDAGISGYGESGVTGSMMKAWLERYKPLLLKQDPLAIQYHWFRMSTVMHTYMASIPALSGIDMALWDLAGRLRGEPVYKLLGGPFRDEVPIFINSEPRNMLDREAVKAWADTFKASPQGFKAAKVNTTSAIGKPMGRYLTTLSAVEINKIRTAFENIREALGPEYDIMVHCHNEYDLPTAKAIAGAVESIQPKWLEDPLPPPFSDSWVALKRECRVPLLTGEKLEMPQGYYPFLKEQAVDFIYPDIAFCGGITSIMKIASLAALYRIPVATHNVGGVLLTMASIHFGLSIHDFLTSEGRLGGRRDVLIMAKNPPVIKNGAAQKPEAPGLGVDLDDAGVKAWQREGDSPDWV